MEITILIAKRGTHSFSFFINFKIWFPTELFLIVSIRYSVSVQLVCDHNKKFIAYHAGFPGSCHDSYVFQHMIIHQDPQSHFDSQQYLLADSAYASGQYVVPAF